MSPARVIGKGVYWFTSKMHTHLVYKLELPIEDDQNEVQESLHIKPHASFIIQIKNTNASSTTDQFRGLRNKWKATFPAQLKGVLGKKWYGPADPPNFLDHEGCELLLISALDDIEEELGVEVETESCDPDDPCCSDLAQLFGDVIPIEPLFHGTWL